MVPQFCGSEPRLPVPLTSHSPLLPRRYGYSYGCAAADVWHLVHHTAMLYPGYEVLGEAG